MGLSEHQLLDFIEVLVRTCPVPDVRLRKEKPRWHEEAETTVLSVSFQRPIAPGGMLVPDIFECCLDMQTMTPMGSDELVEYVDSRFDSLIDQAFEQLKVMDSEVEPDAT